MSAYIFWLFLFMGNCSCNDFASSSLSGGDTNGPSAGSMGNKAASAMQIGTGATSNTYGAESYKTPNYTQYTNQDFKEFLPNYEDMMSKSTSSSSSGGNGNGFSNFSSLNEMLKGFMDLQKEQLKLDQVKQEADKAKEEAKKAKQEAAKAKSAKSDQEYDQEDEDETSMKKQRAFQAVDSPLLQPGSPYPPRKKKKTSSAKSFITSPSSAAAKKVNIVGMDEISSLISLLDANSLEPLTSSVEAHDDDLMPSYYSSSSYKAKLPAQKSSPANNKVKEIFAAGGNPKLLAEETAAAAKKKKIWQLASFSSPPPKHSAPPVESTLSEEDRPKTPPGKKHSRKQGENSTAEEESFWDSLGSKVSAWLKKTGNGSASSSSPTWPQQKPSFSSSMPSSNQNASPAEGNNAKGGKGESNNPMTRNIDSSLASPEFSAGTSSSSSSHGGISLSKLPFENFNVIPSVSFSLNPFMGGTNMDDEAVINKPIDSVSSPPEEASILPSSDTLYANVIRPQLISPQKTFLLLLVPVKDQRPIFKNGLPPLNGEDDVDLARRDDEEASLVQPMVIHELGEDEAKTLVLTEGIVIGENRKRKKGDLSPRGLSRKRKKRSAKIGGENDAGKKQLLKEEGGKINETIKLDADNDVEARRVKIGFVQNGEDAFPVGTVENVSVGGGKSKTHEGGGISVKIVIPPRDCKETE